ncbi:MAG TPA: DUF2460 domain-containing protein [Bryobacteraceae bacterium]|nr:DUF2460 domain-containing protein [Bryobacteraceae bacterium]
MPLPLFPKLKTGAITQYPAKRGIVFSTRVMHFVDGSSQRFRDFGSPVTRWVVHLEQLTTAEAGELMDFYVDRQGSFGSFRFIDAASGSEYGDCSFEENVFDYELRGESAGRLILTIRNNRAQ